MIAVLSLYFIQTFPQGMFSNFTTSIFIHNFRTVQYVLSAIHAPCMFIADMILLLIVNCFKESRSYVAGVTTAGMMFIRSFSKIVQLF
jgi:hypothetical protein